MKGYTLKTTLRCSNAVPRWGSWWQGLREIRCSGLEVQVFWANLTKFWGTRRIMTTQDMITLEWETTLFFKNWPSAFPSCNTDQVSSSMMIIGYSIYSFHICSCLGFVLQNTIRHSTDFLLLLKTRKIKYLPQRRTNKIKYVYTYKFWTYLQRQYCNQ